MTELCAAPLPVRLGVVLPLACVLDVGHAGRHETGDGHWWFAEVAAPTDGTA